MSTRNHAVRSGLARGWHEYRLSLRSPQDWGFYVFLALVTVGYLWLNRNNDVELGSVSMSLPAYVMPSMLGALIAFGLVIGPGYSLAMEREDGTLLRLKSAPYGLIGYVSGQVLLHTLGIIPTFVIVLVPSAFLFEDLMANGAEGWLTVLWVTILGLLATLPIGIILGSLVPSVQKMGTWGFFPIMGLVAISGIFFPIQALWGWVQIVAQLFPVYWLGLGMRSAFLPESAAALEIGASWRTGLTILVLTSWAIVGLVFAPRVLRKMAKHQSGSAVQAAREAAGQWVQ
ncbi:MAG TPA: ABC transporter permease [Acidimicrobiia bacterium]|nr:ABC transporter permease [Acidimicrobiia bacterium]